MPSELKLSGFDELRRELAALPKDLQRESAPILLDAATRAQAAIVAAYPIITGGLRAGVKVIKRTAHGIATLYTLVTEARYAHIYEFGSARQRPRPTFLPVSEPARRDAVIAVADLVESHGLQVTGDRD